MTRLLKPACSRWRWRDEANKHYLQGGELSDSKGNPTGFTAKEWIQKQNDAYTELKTGNLDEKLRNLYVARTISFATFKYYLEEVK